MDSDSRRFAAGINWYPGHMKKTLHRDHSPEGDLPQFGRQLARRYIADEETAGIPPPVRLAMAMPCRDASMP